MNIIAWGNIAPWAEQRQMEQDLGFKPSDRARGDQALPSADRMLAKDNWPD